MIETKKYTFTFFLTLLIIVMACSKNSHSSNTIVNDTNPYNDIKQYMCKCQISEGLDYVDSMQSSPDKFILRAYMFLYSSDSSYICSVLDSAWIGKTHNEGNSQLLYNRCMTSALILASENVNDFSRALSYAQRAIKICENDSTIGNFCDNCNMLGLIYFQTGKIVESIKSYRACLDHVTNKDKTAELQAYLGLAYIFHKWSRKKIELEYASKAIDIVSKLRELDAYTSCNVSRIAGIAFEDNNEPDSALYYYRQAFQTAVMAGMTYYTEILKKNILDLQASGKNYPIHESQIHSLESNMELRNMINAQVRELKATNENLKSDLFHESVRNKTLLFVCLFLGISILGVIIYLERYYRHNKKIALKSESRIREIEIALETQTINAWLAEKDTERFMQHFRTKYPIFVSNLQQRNNTITKNDLVLCALIALGESNSSIQEIRHISKESLWAARYRIRTKLNLSHEEKLEEFLRNLIL